MRSSNIGRRTALTSMILAALALAAPLAAGAAHVHVAKPTVVTGSATHVLATSALLTGDVNPKGAETSYYFQWGPSTAYGAQTPTVAAGTGEKRKVGQAITGLQPGITYHYRLVAVYAGGTVFGHDHTLTAKGSTLRFEVTKPSQVRAGVPFILSGALRGVGGAPHAVVLQASPYPYLEPFQNIGAAGTTNAAGLFSFRITNLSSSTQFRFITLDARPVYSAIVTVRVALNVTLHARSSGHAGLVRLYGTVTPARPGTHVLIQWQKAVRPGQSGKSSEEESRYVSVFTTKTKRGSASFSRFSAVLNVRHTGRYRAYVKIPPGALISGSSPSVALRKG